MNHLPLAATAEELKAFIKAQQAEYENAKQTMQRLQPCFDEYELARNVVYAFEHGGMTPLRDARIRLSQMLLKKELGEET